MSDTNHNLEVAKEEFAKIDMWPNQVMYDLWVKAWTLSASLAYAEKESAIEAIDAELLSQQAARISELERVVASQAEALKFVKSELYAGMVPIMQKKVDAAISASAESVAAWEAKKLEPLRREVAMLRKALTEAGRNEPFAPFAKSRITEALINTQATAEAYDRELRIDERLYLARCFREHDSGISAAADQIARMLEGMAEELSAQSEQSAQKKEGE